MDTADDAASETRSLREEELVWDHAGDVETNPLLGRNGVPSTRPPSSMGPDTLHLTREQAQSLLGVLDNARCVLETFVREAQGAGGGGASSDSGGSRRPEHGWWYFHCFPRRRRAVARFIFLITVIIQAISLTVVSIIDVLPRKGDRVLVMWTGIMMLFLQLFNLFFVIMVSLRLVRQLYKHKVSILLLAQSYLANLLLFAGIYTLTYRIKPHSWKFIEEDLDEDPVLVVELYAKFLYYSVSTATLCGSDNVLAKDWYNLLFAGFQMLMSFVYYASILGQTLSQDTQYWLGFKSNNNDNSGPPATTSRPVSRMTNVEGTPPSLSQSPTLAALTSANQFAGNGLIRNYGSRDNRATPTLLVGGGWEDGGGGGGGGEGRGGGEGKKRVENGSTGQGVTVVEIERDNHAINT